MWHKACCVLRTSSPTWVVLVLAPWGVGAVIWHVAQPRPRPVVPVPAEVVPVEWHDSLLEPMPHALDSTGWANAEVVEMVGRALEATMNPLSSGTWRPGFEAHLRLKGFTDVQIRAALLRAYAVISIEVADAVFAELGKPGP